MVTAAVIALMPVIAGSMEIILHECELPLVPNGGGIIVDHCQRQREILVFAAGCILLLYWAGERIFPDHPLSSPLVHEKSARLPMIFCGGLLQFDLGYDDTIEFQALDGEMIYIGLNGYLDPEPSTSAFPELSRYYSFGTGRGYIWLNSLPILKNCIFKGLGEGQFAFWFPQDDIVGMLNTHGTTALLTDKPHSMYLGIALSDGIPALVLFACLVFVAVKRGVFPAMGGRDDLAVVLPGHGNSERQQRRVFLAFLDLRGDMLPAFRAFGVVRQIKRCCVIKLDIPRPPVYLCRYRRRYPTVRT